MNDPAGSTWKATPAASRPAGPARSGAFALIRRRLSGQPLVVVGWGLAALVTAVSAIALAPHLHLRDTGGAAAPGPPHAPVASPAASPSSATGCSASLMVTKSWATGFQATVTVRNNGPSAIRDWTVTWAFPGDQAVVQMWNGHFTQVKEAVTVKSLGWNASPDASGSATFGFVGQGSAPPTIDGLKCTTP